MFLTKNRLRKPRKTIEDDEMLYYLKFSHFDDDDVIGKDFMHDKATQFPETMNKSTQTKGKETSDKGVDTYDDLYKIVGDYILQGNDKSINKNDKMVQVNAYKINSRSSSGSERDEDDSGVDREGFISRSARTGFRLAEVAFNTAITTANVSMAVADTIADLVFASQAEVEQHQQQQQEEQQEIISVHSSPPQTINSSPPPETINSSSSSGSDDISRDRSRSRDDDSSGRSSENIGQGLLQRDASRSRSITPSTPASSAKTTPRKKSK